MSDLINHLDQGSLTMITKHEIYMTPRGWIFLTLNADQVYATVTDMRSGAFRTIRHEGGPKPFWHTPLAFASLARMRYARAGLRAGEEA